MHERKKNTVNTKDRGMLGTFMYGVNLCDCRGKFFATFTRVYRNRKHPNQRFREMRLVFV
jgi:hypothetical protein